MVRNFNEICKTQGIYSISHTVKETGEVYARHRSNPSVLITMLRSWLLCSFFLDQKLEPIEQMKILDLICWGISLWQVLGHMHYLSSSLQPCGKDIAIISMFKWRTWSYGIKQHTPNHWAHQSHERKPRLVVFILFYFKGKSKPRFGAKARQVPSFAENSVLISRCGNQGRPSHSWEAKLWRYDPPPDKVAQCDQM